ncbi:hypothetical protein ACQKFG_17690 [Peribacillus sp. NPDC076916]|uniref:hypothetical protein n=1 Tax=Peribacillus sp. NPDC076916 TaxID=3390608 RepID=UPI003D029A36
MKRINARRYAEITSKSRKFTSKPLKLTSKSRKFTSKPLKLTSKSAYSRRYEKSTNGTCLKFPFSKEYCTRTIEMCC